MLLISWNLKLVISAFKLEKLKSHSFESNPSLEKNNGTKYTLMHNLELLLFFIFLNDNLELLIIFLFLDYMTFHCINVIIL